MKFLFMRIVGKDGYRKGSLIQGWRLDPIFISVITKDGRKRSRLLYDISEIYIENELVYPIKGGKVL